MNSDWPLVPLGEVLTRVTRQTELAAEVAYRQLTVRLWGKGIVLRREVVGAEIASSRQTQVRSAQLVLSRIDARNGAIGLVPADLDGAIVSSDFPVFSIDVERIVPAYLEWLTRTRDFTEACRSASEGTTNRIRLRDERFLGLTVPIPPLPEQRRIVAKIDAVAGKVQEAEGLRQRAALDLDSLRAAAVSAVLSPREGWEEATVGQLCHAPQYGYTASARLEGDGPRFLRITDIQAGQVNWAAVPFCDCPDVDAYRLRAGDIVFARTGATTGKSYLVKECPLAVFASYLIRLRVKRRVTPDFLYGFFQSRAYWSQIAAGQVGTGQANLNGTKLSVLRVPVPPRQVQQRLVTQLNDIEKQVGDLKPLQEQTAADLDALMPSVLDKAFRGEL